MARLFPVLCLSAILQAQVYSPKVLSKGQPDPSNLKRFSEAICDRADAHTPRERAEAVWRYFLTDGRFVKPGFWYHIAGWAYEEPAGEVLDPLKLLNSYGFGLCYQIAPVLEAVWKAGGLEDARVWFLTGHTVAEVYYEGAYHYFDSDMMGYNTLGRGPARTSTVASVRNLERDGSIITSKLNGGEGAASDPWYPADVRAGAIGDLAGLFTSTADNRVFPFERAPSGQDTDFELRPGERLVRNFTPEREDLYYLPYKRTAHGWEEFPREIAQYAIKTKDGPRSQKDARRWATGRIEWRPLLETGITQVHEVRSPYVIIDAEFQVDAVLSSAAERLSVETSSDGGRTWTLAAALRGVHRGVWRAEPAVVVHSDHGRLTAVSGRYGYLVRLNRSPGAVLHDLRIFTHVQLNPRTLPQLIAGHNELVYTAGPATVRRDLPIEPAAAREAAYSVSNARWLGDVEQGYWIAEREGPAEFVFRIGSSPLVALHAGGRFLDLSSGLAPDKFTAEVRRVTPIPARRAAASIAWSRSPEGPFETLWEFDPKLKWKDGDAIDRTLVWPEVDRTVALGNAREVYVRYRVQDLAIDQFRIATQRAAVESSALTVTHVWAEDRVRTTHTVSVPAGVREHRYAIDVPAGRQIENLAIVFECR